MRSNILQPLNLENSILERQKCVKEFVENKEKCLDLCAFLKNFKELENIAVKFMYKIKESSDNSAKSYILHIYKLHNMLKKIFFLQSKLDQYDF